MVFFPLCALRCVDLFILEIGVCYFMFLVAFVGLCPSVRLSSCLSVCQQHYSKGYEQIAMEFYGRVRNGKRIRSCLGRAFAISTCLEYDDCLWIFGGKGVSLNWIAVLMNTETLIKITD